MSKEEVAYVDYETEGIEGRPAYPPKPVGVSVKFPGKKSKYYAWGHPEKNNCTIDEAKLVLEGIWKNPKTKVSFHNGKFDMDVAESSMGLPLLPPERIEDTMIMAYLVDPHSKQVDLKSLAQKHLGMEPEERDAVREWLVDHRIIPKTNKASWGDKICLAPGDIVGKYACGDTDRTAALAKKFSEDIRSAGMYEAYMRELRLIPILLENEREGVFVDVKKLAEDVDFYTKTLEGKVEPWIRKWLGVKEINLDSGSEIADALDRKIPDIAWPLTEKGQRSTSKESLEEVLMDFPEALAFFQYRASVNTCVRTFMRPWLTTALQTGGKIHTQWNSVAQEEGGGARTGRLSSSPNFQNIPTLKSPKFKVVLRLWEQYLKKHGIPPMPSVRSYIVADSKNHVILDRDFSQQELRVLAHFEDGGMMEAYLADPKIDLHQFAADVITETTGVKLDRKATKNIAFALLYGMGLNALAELLDVDIATAKQLKKAYLDTFPGVKDIQKDLKWRAQNDLCMTTWGGRRYFVEPARLIKGRFRTFDYKLFNYLIQGSSADLTKEAVIRYHNTKKNGRLLLTVHDQILACAPKKAWKGEMKILREAMEGLELSVPLLSEGEYGYRWTELEKCE